MPARKSVKLVVYGHFHDILHRVRPCFVVTIGGGWDGDRLLNSAYVKRYGLGIGTGTISFGEL
ncbi:hypothetical protein [Loktanella sp. Alg231-35]|uniref:hypothetical protein n=1 Tax=Loktanella sp. Alg231-35 TaxID=1922220 RepID=UPI000D54DE0E|nr:hypothetical protein [Loktanella sp. Alg231-35]